MEVSLSEAIDHSQHSVDTIESLHDAEDNAQRNYKYGNYSTRGRKVMC